MISPYTKWCESFFQGQLLDLNDSKQDGTQELENINRDLDMHQRMSDSGGDDRETSTIDILQQFTPLKQYFAFPTPRSTLNGKKKQERTSAVNSAVVIGHRQFNIYKYTCI